MPKNIFQKFRYFVSTKLFQKILQKMLAHLIKARIVMCSAGNATMQIGAKLW